MSELCNSENNILSLVVIPGLIYICSLIFSHPLYFSYFVFFSPYIFKLISFLSPLFITTFLLFLAIITQLTPTQFVATFTSLLEILQSKKDGDFQEIHCFEDLELYKVVFGEVKQDQVGILEEKSQENSHLQASETTNICNIKEEESSILGAKIENSCPELMEEKRMDNFLKILGDFERMSSSSNVEEKKKTMKIEPSASTKIDKVVENHKVSNGSKATECNFKIKAHSQRVSSSFDYTNENSPKFGYSNNLSIYGSMRKEKEWKRTLACKLFEERHNVDGGEGMDSLWETYENDPVKPKSMKEKIKKMKKNESEVDKVYGYDEDEDINAQLCCLQALKLSAGKMNLGIGRPNLVKFSKAIKGFGWLHHVSKNSKKVHDNGDRY